jgi:hypothetical protein
LRSYVSVGFSNYQCQNPYYALKAAQSLIRAGDLNEAKRILYSFDNAEIILMEDNGNSFYAAIVEQFKRSSIRKENGEGYMIQDVRKEALSFLAMKPNWEAIQNLLSKTHNIETYKALHEKDGQPPDHGMISAVALKFGLTLRIVDAKTRCVMWVNNGPESQPLIQLQFSGSKYDLLVRKSITALDSLAGYYVTMFELQLKESSSILHRTLNGIIGVKAARKSIEERKSIYRTAQQSLMDAKSRISDLFSTINSFFERDDYRRICIDKEQQAHNSGDNMMHKHLESEQTLYLAMSTHIDDLHEKLDAAISANQEPYIKRVFRLDELSDNGLNVNIPANDILPQELTFADSICIESYFELELLNDLTNDEGMAYGRARVVTGATMLSVAYIPGTQWLSPIVGTLAGKLIRKGLKVMLSKLLQDDDLDDEMEDIGSYISDAIASFGGPAAVVPKILYGILKDIGQSFFVKVVLHKCINGMTNKVHELLKKPLADLVETPFQKLCEWRDYIYNSVKSVIFEPIQTFFQKLLGDGMTWVQTVITTLLAAAQNTLNGAAQMICGTTQSNQTSGPSVLDQLNEAKQLFLSLLEGITGIKSRLMEFCEKGIAQFQKLKSVVNIFKQFKDLSFNLKSFQAFIDLVEKFASGDMLKAVTDTFNFLSSDIARFISSLPGCIALLAHAFEKLKGIVTSLIQDPHRVLYWLLGSLPIIFLQQIAENARAFLSKIFQGVVSKFQSILNWIFDCNPLDKWLKSWGIDFTDFKGSLSRITTNIIQGIIKQVKALLFQPPKSGQPNDTNGCSQNNMAQQCVPFALMQLFQVNREEFLAVVRSYFADEIKNDKGLTKWQAKFIMQDFDLKVIEDVFTRKPGTSSSLIAFTSKVLQDNKSVGGIGMFVNSQGGGHAYILKAIEGNQAQLIDETHSNGVDDNLLVVFSKGSLLVPFNFTQSKRDALTVLIKNRQITHSKFAFVLWFYRILETLFPGQRFGDSVILAENRHYVEANKKNKEFLFHIGDWIRQEGELSMNIVDMSLPDNELYLKMQKYAYQHLDGDLTQPASRNTVTVVTFNKPKDVFLLIYEYHNGNPLIKGKDLIIRTKSGQYGYIRREDVYSVSCDPQLSMMSSEQFKRKPAVLYADMKVSTEVLKNVLNKFGGTDQFGALDEMTASMAYLICESCRNVDTLFFITCNPNTTFTELLGTGVKWCNLAEDLIKDKNPSAMLMKLHHRIGCCWRKCFNDTIDFNFQYIKNTRSSGREFHLEGSCDPNTTKCEGCKYNEAKFGVPTIPAAR